MTRSLHVSFQMLSRSLSRGPWPHVSSAMSTLLLLQRILTPSDGWKATHNMNAPQSNSVELASHKFPEQLPLRPSFDGHPLPQAAILESHTHISEATIWHTPISHGIVSRLDGAMFPEKRDRVCQIHDLTRTPSLACFVARCILMFQNFLCLHEIVWVEQSVHIFSALSLWLVCVCGPWDGYRRRSSHHWMSSAMLNWNWRECNRL